MSNEVLRYIPFTRSDVTDEDIDSISDIIKDSEKDTYKLVSRCEQNFAGITKLPYAIAVHTAMHAILLSLSALGIKQGDEVIIPSYVSPDVGEAVEHTGASVVFADIDPRTLTISTESVIKGTGPKTKAIVVFDAAGFAADVKPIMQLAASNGIHVIHYTYHNPMKEYRNKTAGSYPHITIFSSNEPFINGAIVATDMENTQSLIKGLREHGIKTSKNYDADNRYSNWYYEITSPGFDCMMTGIQCALYAVYMKKMGQYIEQRKHIAKTYNGLFQPFQGIISLPLFEASDISHTWQLYVIRIIKDSMLVNRDEFIHELKQKGVEASVHYIPLHIHPYYSKKYRYNYNTLPNTYDTYTSAVSLPLYARLSDDDAGYVAQTVIDIVKRYSR
jgi:dTDP-4-amino-4,6-dideoxygalactose transaminase